jgi:hypothetical protein
MIGGSVKRSSNHGRAMYHPEFDGYDDGPPAPTLITVNGRTSFRHMVSNAGAVLALLRTHRHVLAIGAHNHVGERVTLINEGVRTRFEQSPAVGGPAGAAPFVFPAGIVKYTIAGGRVGEGVFLEVDAAKANQKPNQRRCAAPRARHVRRISPHGAMNR